MGELIDGKSWQFPDTDLPRDNEYLNTQAIVPQVGIIELRSTAVLQFRSLLMNFAVRKRITAY